MMGYKAITQIILFIISLVIIFMYIKPALIEIKADQDQLFEYADASAKASEFNSLLAQLLEVEQSFATSDIKALDTYLPSSVDEMVVMADIVTIAEQSGSKVTTITAGEQQMPVGDVVFGGETITAATDSMSYVDFSLAITADYESFKILLKNFEQNIYPLEVVTLSFGAPLTQDESVVTSLDVFEGVYDIVLRTYSYSPINN